MTESEMMRGGCFALAEWLHHATGLPLYGIVGTPNEIHHAFVVDGDMAYDGRGEVELKSVHSYKGRAAAGGMVEPISLSLLQEYSQGLFYIHPDEIEAFCDQNSDLSDLLDRCDGNLEP
jgi:hypothetical protein